jgi:hypothetical protein
VSPHDIFSEDLNVAIENTEKEYQKIAEKLGFNVYKEGGSWVARRDRDRIYGAGDTYSEAVVGMITNLAKQPDAFLWTVENAKK